MDPTNIYKSRWQCKNVKSGCNKKTKHRKGTWWTWPYFPSQEKHKDKPKYNAIIEQTIKQENKDRNS